MADNGWLWSLNGGKGGYKPGYGPQAAESVKTPAEAVKVEPAGRTFEQARDLMVHTVNDVRMRELQANNRQSTTDSSPDWKTASQRSESLDRSAVKSYRSAVKKLEKLRAEQQKIRPSSAEEFSRMKPVFDKLQAQISAQQKIVAAAIAYGKKLKVGKP